MPKLCGNPMLDEQEQLMRQYEQNRDPIETVIKYAQDFPHGDEVKPCARCHQVTELEECPFCLRAYCDGCSHEHYCTVEILRGAK